MMSAPAARYSWWIALITSGRVRTRRSLLPFRSFVMVAKRSPRKSASRQLVALDHRAHRAVEDEDALREQGAACRMRAVECHVRSSCVRHAVLAPSRGASFVLRVRSRCRLAGFVPLAISTVNGSPVRRAPTPTVTSVSPAPSSSAVSCVVGEAEPAIAEPVAHPRLRWCSRRSSTSTRPPGTRMRAASASARCGIAARGAAPATAARRRRSRPRSAASRARRASR